MFTKVVQIFSVDVTQTFQFIRYIAEVIDRFLNDRLGRICLGSSFSNLQI